ncbi:MAG: type II toxin-antitoxin system prevent-host-death family antitoxin [Actinomycetales bacterium]|nr:type II toxin-antitoxin system prevent-host-death family antitoxin [Actinomycetales bacterium]
MDEVSIRDLRNHGGEVIDAVAAGESVTVTRQGRPVARLVPVKERGTTRAELKAAWVGVPRVDYARLRRDIDEVIDQSW